MAEFNLFKYFLFCRQNMIALMIYENVHTENFSWLSQLPLLNFNPPKNCQELI